MLSLSDCAHKIYRAVLSLLLGIAFYTYFLISWLLSLDDLKNNTTKPDANINAESTDQQQHPESLKKEVKAIGYAAHDPSGVLTPFNFTRRSTGDHDVQFKILYCGICHSDLHAIKNEWGGSGGLYPMVPGHEIVGEVTEVGSKVNKVKIGDKVGVGCLVNSCRNCDSCAADLEQFCPGAWYTFKSRLPDGSLTYGGYSNIMVANEDFIIKWPENFPLDRGAPLLCAGVTVYSPMKYFGLDKPGLHIGIAGLGGLGHVGVKFAKAFGAKVTVISTSASKKKEAMESFGADAFIVSREPTEMEAAAGTLDGIIDTVSAPHEIQPYLGLLKTNGKLIVVGLPEKPLEVPAFSIVIGRKMVAGSLIGGMKETQEMIDFAAKHNILADVEIVGMDYVNTAMERLAKNDVKFRFVIDVGKTLEAE